MTTKTLEFASIEEVAALLRSSDLSSVQVTTAMLDRIERLDGRLNAFITVTADQALEQARRADSELEAGQDRGPLHGIPVAVKDLFATAGILTTGGSKYYEDWVPDSDAAAVSKLDAAGAVMLGKTGLHELAFGSTSINSHYGPVSNPWMLDHHPGGSSGGSAAAVAAGLAFAALGTDTGCSVRQPAQCCGIVGYKPTFDLVSTEGVLPLVSSMDHVGPLTRTVRDAALVLNAIQGGDADAPDGSPRDYSKAFQPLLDEVTVGVPRAFFFDGGDSEVIGIVDAALSTFDELGAKVIDADIPYAEEAYRAADVTFSEIAAAHGHGLAENPDAFSEPFRCRFDAVTRHSAEDYANAQKFRQTFRSGVEDLLSRCDVLAMPTSTVAAAPIAEQPRDHDVERRKNCCIFNFTGQPAISISCGFTAAGLPVGLMLVGALLDDATVLRVARSFEAETSWHQQHPILP